jgi:hypothetical protein
VLADQAPEALGGFLGAVLDHCQAARDVVRVAVAHFVVVAVLVTTAATRMAAAVQPLDDEAKRLIDARDVIVAELAPDTVPQLLQLAARVSNMRFGRAAGGVVGGTSRHERSVSVIELFPMRGVVLGLRLDAFGLALQLVQQTRVTARTPFVLPLLTTGTTLSIGHLVLLRWLSAWSFAGGTGPFFERGRYLVCVIAALGKVVQLGRAVSGGFGGSWSSNVTSKVETPPRTRSPPPAFPRSIARSMPCAQ